MTYKPLKPNWKIQEMEDCGVPVETQIQDQVNSEAFVAWCRKTNNSPMLFRDRLEYLSQLGRNYMKLSSLT